MNSREAAAAFSRGRKPTGLRTMKTKAPEGATSVTSLPVDAAPSGLEDSLK